MSYKRNQVEEAISRLFSSDCERPSAALLTRKSAYLSSTVLLVARFVLTMLIFSDEAPKTGAVISFSNMKHCAVSWIENHGTRLAAGVRYFFIMRRVRLDLEREYARILSQRPRDAF
jgi:hypothetical protein